MPVCQNPPQPGVSDPRQLTSGHLAQQARVPIARLSQLRAHLQNGGFGKNRGGWPPARHGAVCQGGRGFTLEAQ